MKSNESLIFYFYQRLDKNKILTIQIVQSFEIIFFIYKIGYLVILISFCDNYIFEVGQCQNGKSKELLIV